MRAFLFVCRAWFRTAFRRAGMLLAWSVCMALVLLTATALWALPPYQSAGLAQSQRLFLLTLSPLLSEAEITRLAWDIWAWPEVIQVSFRFPGEADPLPLSERTLVVEVHPQGLREETAARLGKLPEVTKVTVLERTVIPPRVPSAARIGTVVALLVTLGGALALGARTLRRAQGLWEEEARLLQESGASPLVRRGPVFLLSALCGLLAAGLHALVLRWGVPWIPPELVGSPLQPLVPWALGLGVPAGLLLGLLAAFLSPHS